MSAVMTAAMTAAMTAVMTAAMTAIKTGPPKCFQVFQIKLFMLSLNHEVSAKKNAQFI
jgi:hypothetical protein